MTEHLEGTPLALVEAAGELFGECGYDGTSVRAIADRAGANVAAINYHFGSKENLYTEVLRHVARCGKPFSVQSLIDADPAPESAAGLARIVSGVVRLNFEPLTTEDVPSWHGLVILRALLDPTPSLREIVEQMFAADHEAFSVLLAKAKPDLTTEQAQTWAFFIRGQSFFFEFARAPILILIQRDDYDPSYVEAVVEQAVRFTLAALGLPMLGSDGEKR